VRAFVSWLFSPKYVWACFVVLAVAFVVCLRPGTSEPVIRLTGLVLQLIGIFTVLWGISETRAQFGRPSIASVMRQWLSAIPLGRKKIVSATASVNLGPVTARARGYGTHNPVDQTVGSRLDAIEKNIGVVHDRITAFQNETDQELRKLADRVREEQGARSQEDQAIRAC
jgi:hypothetical protein